jgi:hypothetical protein
MAVSASVIAARPVEASHARWRPPAALRPRRNCTIVADDALRAAPRAMSVKDSFVPAGAMNAMN